MPVDLDIAYVARLARMALDEEELAIYRGQLGVILEHAAKVQDVETEGFDPTAHPLGIVNQFRDDEIRPSLDRGELLAAAPATDGAYFMVPPALET